MLIMMRTPRARDLRPPFTRDAAGVAGEQAPRKRPRPNAPPVYNKLQGSRARGMQIAASMEERKAGFSDEPSTPTSPNSVARSCRLARSNTARSPQSRDIRTKLMLIMMRTRRARDTLAVHISGVLGWWSCALRFPWCCPRGRACRWPQREDGFREQRREAWTRPRIQRRTMYAHFSQFSCMLVQACTE